ncbi:MAG TPA: hypothetical protein HA255_00410 [Methanosphaera sp.]|nr:hypothetical protein [Methanosphaera sp.]
MTENKRFIEFATQNTDDGKINNGFYDMQTDEYYYTKDSETAKKICDMLDELHEEKEWLEINNKDLVSFIKSKGYTLKDFIKYLGQFRSVGVNKEDWND